MNLETRVFVQDYRSVEINSPGEPGVAYIMGSGFGGAPQAGTSKHTGLDGFRRRARERNLVLLDRINEAVPDVRLDYEKDVLPLTPAGMTMERHIVSASVY